MCTPGLTCLSGEEVTSIEVLLLAIRTLFSPPISSHKEVTWQTNEKTWALDEGAGQGWPGAPPTGPPLGLSTKQPSRDLSKSLRPMEPAIWVPSRSQADRV